ncbi:8712_t:CDS:2 [Funneliformis geosporum]|nr:8712_t:CDS:2 [Funneliformis geosporum]
MYNGDLVHAVKVFGKLLEMSRKKSEKWLKEYQMIEQELGFGDEGNVEKTDEIENKFGKKHNEVIVNYSAAFTSIQPHDALSYNILVITMELIYN